MAQCFADRFSLPPRLAHPGGKRVPSEAPMRAFRPFVFALALLMGCGDATPDTPVDAAVARDTGLAVDTGPLDAGNTAVDAGNTVPDTGPQLDAGSPVDTGNAPQDVGTPSDAGSPADAGRFDIVGDVSGACGTLRAMLRSPTPSLVDNSIVFMMGEQYVRSALSPGGQRMYDTPNAGGSSVESEVISFEMLHHCEGATLHRTETEVMYQPVSDAGSNAITDLVVDIGGERVGVSVTRAWRPMPLTYPESEVRTLLIDKLNGINRSSQRVLPADRWVKQILHVFVADMAMADTVRRIWNGLDATVRADTIVLVTLTRGGGFMFCNPDPALGAECPPIRN